MRYDTLCLSDPTYLAYMEEVKERFEQNGWELVDYRVGPDVDQSMTRDNIYISLPDIEQSFPGKIKFSGEPVRDILEFWEDLRKIGKLKIGNRTQIRYRDALEYFEVAMVCAGRVDEFIKILKGN